MAQREIFVNKRLKKPRTIRQRANSNLVFKGEREDTFQRLVALTEAREMERKKNKKRLFGILR